jgi:hypothetical protein
VGCGQSDPGSQAQTSNAPSRPPLLQLCLLRLLLLLYGLLLLVLSMLLQEFESSAKLDLNDTLRLASIW